MKPRSYNLQELTWRQAQALIPTHIDTIILPVGTVEAHGVSCIGTDNVIPDSLARAIAPQVNALIAPIVNHGITRSLYRYPGSTTISPENFKRYIGDILLSFHHSGFRNCIILNGHGGNNAALKEIALECNHQHGLNVAVLHWWELCDEVTKSFFGQSGAHAGIDETALVMAVNPAYATPSEFTPDMVYTFLPGADVYPVPGTILTTKAGEGAPLFDVEKAKLYQSLVVEKVSAAAQFILRRWREAGLA